MANTMPPDIARKLLDKLSSDDDFRDRFVKDPAAAIGQLGYDLPSDQAACLQVKSLADKDAIRASRDELQKSFTEPAVFRHHSLGS